MLKRSGFKGWLIRWLEENRSLVVLLFCLPAGFIFDLVLRIHHAILLKYYSSPRDHAERVKEIQGQVRTWKRSTSRKLLCTARPNWLSLSLTFFKKEECHKIRVDLHNILDLDVNGMKVKVEPGVTVSQITAYLNKLGYTLPVTLEIGDATLGGLALGTGMTTHSHKAGLYQETVISYEVVLGDGSVVVAMKDNEHSDLYWALPWSHGSLGFLTALELSLIPAKPWVSLTYIPVNGQTEYCDLLRELSGASDPSTKVPDFVEATVFSKDEAVVMIGNFRDGPTSVWEWWSKVNRCSLWYKPWFFEHVRTFLSKDGGGGREELIPVRDYLLRHNRAIFWVVQDMISWGNHPLFRLFLGWLLPPKPAFLKFTTTPGIRALTFTKQVFQDIVLPLNQLEAQIEMAQKLFDTFPILVYPCRIYDHGEGKGQLRPPRKDQMVPGTNYGMFNDLGVYGVPGPVKRKERFDAVKAMRGIEQFTRDVGGYPFLYADLCMTEEEFKLTFDLTLYNQVRKKYGADGAFPTLFEKIRPEIDVYQVGAEYMDPL